MTHGQQKNQWYAKSNRYYHRFIAVISLAVLIVCIGCSPDVNIEMPDKTEYESVWQHLKVYSIYQDKIADNPFSYNTLEDMFLNLGDTLKGAMNRYTWYVNHNIHDTMPEWLAKSGSSDVIFSKLTDSCCLLKITTFLETSDVPLYEQFKAVLSKVANYRNVIVDLRENGGGNLLTTDNIIEDMIPAGVQYLRTKERIFNSEKQGGITVDSVWYTKRAVRNEFSNKKFAVLVDGRTGSAAEVLALALKDGLGAPMYGVQTYGKGIGQIYIQRRDRLWLRITCMHFYRINGSVDYHRVGISPDTPSAQLVSEGATERDPYIYYAVKTLQPSVQKEQITYPTLVNNAPVDQIGGMNKYADELEYAR